MTSKESFYITTPIYYVNDDPHIGHPYTTFACDTMARYEQQLRGYEVKFLTGTDEHGQKIEMAAKTANKEPQAFVDQVYYKFLNLTKVMNLINDDFIRTTEPRHIKAVQALWNKLIDEKQIYLGSYAGWYAVRDEAFYAESELIDGKAPTGAPVEWVTEPSYFFKLSAWQDRLLDFYDKNPDFIQPESRRNEVISFVKGGLLDLSVSRTSFKWGVPVPGDPDHVMYVWLDALTNYITALGYPDINSDDFKKFWPEAVHVVGKDILRFHAVYWPAFLMAAGLEPPKKIFAHGWLTVEGAKMSKSVGNVVSAFEMGLIEIFGSDAVRYFLLREIPFGQDGDFSLQALINRYNSDLANSYGNLVQRVLSFIHKQCNRKVPKHGEFTKEDQVLFKEADSLPAMLEKDMKAFAFHKYAERIWQVIFKANQYVDEQKPWGLKTTDQARMKTILYVLAETIRKLAILTQPILPVASAQILDQLAVTKNRRAITSFNETLQADADLPEPKGVFPRFMWNITLDDLKHMAEYKKLIGSIIEKVKNRGGPSNKKYLIDVDNRTVTFPGLVSVSFYKGFGPYDFSPAMYGFLGADNYPDIERASPLIEDAIYCFDKALRENGGWPI